MAKKTKKNAPPKRTRERVTVCRGRNGAYKHGGSKERCGEMTVCRVGAGVPDGGQFKRCG